MYALFGYVNGNRIRRRGRRGRRERRTSGQGHGGGSYRPDTTDRGASASSRADFLRARPQAWCWTDGAALYIIRWRESGLAEGSETWSSRASIEMATFYEYGAI